MLREEEGAAEWMGRARERKSETRLHSQEMSMVTMATAAESHMMRRSEREREMSERAKKESQSEWVGRLAPPAEGRGGEGRDG